MKKSKRKMITCPCGCGRSFPERGNKKFFSRRCKDRVRNRMRYLKQKKAVELAREILELHGKGEA